MKQICRNCVWFEEIIGGECYGDGFCHAPVPAWAFQYGLSRSPIVLPADGNTAFYCRVYEPKKGDVGV